MNFLIDMGTNITPISFQVTTYRPQNTFFYDLRELLIKIHVPKNTPFKYGFYYLLHHCEDNKKMRDTTLFCSCFETIRETNQSDIATLRLTKRVSESINCHKT